MSPILCRCSLPAGCREHYIFVSLPPLRTAKAKIAQRHRRAENPPTGNQGTGGG